MADHDLIVRGGSVIDGTGTDARSAATMAPTLPSTWYSRAESRNACEN